MRQPHPWYGVPSPKTGRVKVQPCDLDRRPHDDLRESSPQTENHIGHPEGIAGESVVGAGRIRLGQGNADQPTKETSFPLPDGLFV